LRQVNRDLSSVTAEMTKITIDFEQLETQKGSYDLLKAKGFFAPQSRRDAEDNFKAALDESGVLTAKVSLGAGRAYDQADAAQAEYKILSSPIAIEITAIDDVDVYRYLALLHKKFKGFIDVKAIVLQKRMDVSSETLRAIIGEKEPEMVHAKIAAAWKTMIPEVEAINIQNGRNSPGR